ncbi:MAG: hypothetical protein K8U03_10780 [Planctomycetia bacterium]|nr:hypothetical protein [Planctomycetia bacterium]
MPKPTLDRFTPLAARFGLALRGRANSGRPLVDLVPAGLAKPRTSMPSE